MAIVYWTPEALHRLKEIESYVTRQSPRVARDVVARILSRTRQLGDAPRSGRQIPEYQDRHLRELLARPYRIIYSDLPDRVVIISVMHYRQLLPKDPSRLK